MLRDVSELLSFVTGGGIPVQQPVTHQQQQQQQGQEAAAAGAGADAARPAAMFDGWVQALEGWLYEPASTSSRGQQQQQQHSSSSRQPFLQEAGAGDEADSFSLWDLRAMAMFQACLPVTLDGSSSTATGAKASRQLRVAAGGDAACGSDAVKGAPDTPGKAGTDSGEAASDAGGSGSSGSIALAPAEAARMKRAIKTMAAHITALKRTITQLKQDNQRLRAAGASSGGGAPGHHHHRHHHSGAAEDDAMLADAVQSLLADKSALQQELSRLTRHNAALQELLEYTAAAAAAGPSLTSPSRGSLDGAEGGSASSAASSPAGEYAAGGGASNGDEAAAASLIGLAAEEEDTAASGVVVAGAGKQDVAVSSVCEAAVDADEDGSSKAGAPLDGAPA